MTAFRATLFFLCSGACLCAEPHDPLKTLKKSHPRLIASDDRLRHLRTLIRTDPEARMIYRALVEEAGKFDAQPVVAFSSEGGRLASAGVCRYRVETLALLYRLDREKRYLDRARQELRAAAAFPSWSVGHFLDTIYLMHGVAIGYDWLYPWLSDADRKLVRKALVEKGLDPALAVYRLTRGWPHRRFNLNLLFNSGAGLAALAVAGEEAEKPREVLRHVLASAPLALGTFAPDGGWPEGPGYWNFGSSHVVALLAGLKSALGIDFELSAMPGFAQAGRFRIYVEGPTGKAFNFADSGDRVGSGHQLFWMAKRFGEPVYGWMATRLLGLPPRPQPMALVYFDPQAASPQQARWPLDAVFRGAAVAVFRGDWEDPGTLFAAIKGGDNTSAHAHLDLGTFVLDAGGHRWALDLGADSYSLPAYHGSRRWTYYRKRTESHNVVLIDGENQDPAAKAPIVSHAFAPERSEVRIDLSRAYPGKVRRMERTLTLLERRTVRITDTFESDQPREALWGMVTDAEVVLDGAHAELRKPGWVLSARIQSPPGAVFDMVSTSAPAPQNPNTGTRKLVVRLPGKVTDLRLIVSLTPGPVPARASHSQRPDAGSRPAGVTASATTASAGRR